MACYHGLGVSQSHPPKTMGRFESLHMFVYHDGHEGPQILTQETALVGHLVCVCVCRTLSTDTC